MNRNDFKECVRAGKPPDIPEFAVTEALKFYCRERIKNETFSRGDIPECIHLAGMFTITAGKAKPEGMPGIGMEMRFSPDRLVSSEEIYDLIKLEVMEVRRKIFKSPEAPFAEYEEAVSWIEGEAKKTYFPKDKKAFQRAYQEWVARGRELQKHTNVNVGCRLERRTITYAKPGHEWTEAVAVDRGTKLATFENFIRKASARTGFSQPALVLHVLTPIRPLLPRWRLSYTPPMGELRPAGRITVNILAPNVTWKDFRDIYGEINKLLGRRRAAHVDEIDRLVSEVVNRLGGVPPKGKMKFWKAVLKDCKMAGCEGLNSPRAVRIRYERLKRKRRT